MTQQRDMKTLAEILKRAIETSFIRGSNAHDLHEYSNEWDESLRWAHDIEGKKAQEAIAKELMGCLPEKHVCDDSCNIRSNEWEIGHRAYKDAESNVIDEVRARLTAFIGKEVR